MSVDLCVFLLNFTRAMSAVHGLLKRVDEFKWFLRCRVLVVWVVLFVGRLSHRFGVTKNDNTYLSHDNTLVVMAVGKFGRS